MSDSYGFAALAVGAEIAGDRAEDAGHQDLARAYRELAAAFENLVLLMDPPQLRGWEAERPGDRPAG
jgi:hypothetical protein